MTWIFSLRRRSRKPKGRRWLPWLAVTPAAPSRILGRPLSSLRGLPPSRLAVGLVSLAVYVAAIVAANWAIKRFGFVPVGFRLGPLDIGSGWKAPAGVYFAGATFVARDLLQQALGKRVALLAIAIGASVSALVSPSLALASGVSFVVAETADFVVYTPLVERGRILAAVVLADTVGLAVDTTLFLALAFHSLSGWNGTALGKMWMTVAAVGPVWLARRALRPWAMAAPLTVSSVSA